MSGLTPEQWDQLAAISDWVDCNDGDDIAQRIWLAEAANTRLRATVERARHEGAEQALRDAAKWIRSDPGKTSGGGIAEWLTARIDDIA